MEFVTYEVAKKLKEKGFDYPCIGHYVNNQLYIAHYQCAFHSDKDESFDAPTISQVLKWLRTNHGIHVRADLWRKGWYFDVINYEYDESWNEYKVTTKYQSKDYKSYDDAMLAGIEYVLNNLI